MTSGLRKAHKYTWLLLVIIVPIIIIISIKDLGVFSLDKKIEAQLEGSKGISIKSFENDIIKASLYKSRIEIILKTPLKNSSSIVYEVDDQGNKSRIIGQLTTAGIYTFKSNNREMGILVFDDLKHVEITKLIFK